MSQLMKIGCTKQGGVGLPSVLFEPPSDIRDTVVNLAFFYTDVNKLPSLFSLNTSWSLEHQDVNIKQPATHQLALLPRFQLGNFCRKATRCLATSTSCGIEAGSVTTITNSHDESINSTSQSQTQGDSRFWIAAITRQGYAPGYKKDNQDSCLVVQPFLKPGNALLAVADGHGVGGHHVATYLRNKLPGVLLGHSMMSKSWPESMKDTFEQVDDMMANTTNIDTVNSGAALVLSMLEGNTLTTAWAGDSRAVLGVRCGSYRWQAKALTADHKADQPGERSRILRKGGRIGQARNRLGMGVGPHRVFLPDMDYPGLAMSRAIGDHVIRPHGLICSPDVVTHQIQPGTDSFLVLATDGVFEYMSNQQVVDLVGQSLKEHAKTLEQQEASQAADAQKRKHDQDKGNNFAPSSSPSPFDRPVFGDDMRNQAAELALSHTDIVSRQMHLNNPAFHACLELVEAARDKWLQEHSGHYVDDITAVVLAFRQ